ncbi:ABC transporter substrate-binding protein [Treponema pedis]|uniref:ABC transporter substrate-binding protein n=1 Tax=Treponema pedis TaxID=409322 RepID=UPI00046445EB|nr:ABC transporter substrate-binding protein [Treponema pedis]
MKKKIIGLLCLTLVFFMTACFSDKDEKQGSSDKVTQNSANMGTVVVKDMKGDVTIPAEPKRIVDVAGLTEELLILNMNVIASANTSMFDGVSVPEHLKQSFAEKNIEVVGNYSGASSTGDLNLEKIAQLKPDLIIMNIRHDKVYEQLKNIAPTVMINDDISYVNWRGRFKQLGQWFNKTNDVEKWLSDYDSKAAGLSAKIKEAVGDKTFAVLEANSVHFGSYYVYRTGGPGELIYDELKLTPSAGVPENVWGEVVDAEYFSLIDADHIFFFSDDGTAGDTGKLAAWKNLKAVQAGNVHFGKNEKQYNMAYTATGKALYLEKLANAILNRGNVE